MAQRQKQQWRNAMGSHVWTDNDVESLLNVTLKYKVNAI